jgi:putative restriction endonuclease
VLGLAVVDDAVEDYFILRGLLPDGSISGGGANEEQAPSVDPASVEDGRRRIQASIVERQGQGRFRADLIDAYGGRCAITECDVVDVLEAAYIVPYRGRQTNSVSNGLLLRADIHTLFDLGLVTIDTAEGTVMLRPSLAGSSFAALQGVRLRLPEDKALHPNNEALDLHRDKAPLWRAKGKSH